MLDDRVVFKVVDDSIVAVAEPVETFEKVASRILIDEVNIMF